jgi:excisionase family DNA binding protein
MTGGLLTAAEAAALLSVPRTWVLAEARANRIPHVRVGRYVRFRRESLIAWVAERERGPVRREQGRLPASESSAQALRRANGGSGSGAAA